MCHVTRLFKSDWPALYSAGPAHIPQEHGAYASLSRPFLDLFVGGSGYETSTLVGNQYILIACLNQMITIVVMSSS